MLTTDALPPVISSPSAWNGKDLRQREREWLLNLSDDQIYELESAAKFYLSLGLDIAEISNDTFPLPKFSKHLRALKEKLLHGIGVEVLRGLPIAKYSQETIAIIFCGIGAHLGSARSQNAAGHILGHVRDIGSDPNDPNTRIYQTNARQTFHTDSADVVGLLCIKDAKRGGHSLLVSAEAIYNVMREKRPDLVPLLFEPIATDRRGEVPEGMKPFMTIPPLSWHDAKLTVFYQRQYIDSAHRFSDAMPLKKEHIEALDYFDAVANDPSLHLQMHLQPGDMQFVYNHSHLHDRTEFQDWPKKKDRRHLLRLWLSLKGDRNLPECFKQRYGSIEVGNRGGIITNNIKLSAPVSL
ncbi:MAG: taurine catabolism dioxygenase TauD [Rhodobacteraceae bacterium]|nr:taurine catabolism dioxygenase TauD [Paracoccaceae bacterium]